MLIFGDHVPVIPLSDVVGNAGTLDPLQYGPTALNAGVTNGLIVIVKVTTFAHCPAFGVKV